MVLWFSLFLFPRLRWVCGFLTFAALMGDTPLSPHKPAAGPLAPPLYTSSCMLDVQIIEGRKGVFRRRHLTSLPFRPQGGSLRLVSCPPLPCLPPPPLPPSTLNAWGLLTASLLLRYLSLGAPAERQLAVEFSHSCRVWAFEAKGTFEANMSEKPGPVSPGDALNEVSFPLMLAGLRWEQWGTPAPAFPKDLPLLPEREEGRRLSHPVSALGLVMGTPLLGPPPCTHRCRVQVLGGAWDGE